MPTGRSVLASRVTDSRGRVGSRRCASPRWREPELDARPHADGAACSTSWSGPQDDRRTRLAMPPHRRRWIRALTTLALTATGRRLETPWSVVRPNRLTADEAAVLGQLFDDAETEGDADIPVAVDSVGEPTNIDQAGALAEELTEERCGTGDLTRSCLVRIGRTSTLRRLRSTTSPYLHRRCPQSRQRRRSRAIPRSIKTSPTGPTPRAPGRGSCARPGRAARRWRADQGGRGPAGVLRRTRRLPRLPPRGRDTQPDGCRLRDPEQHPPHWTHGAPEVAGKEAQHRRVVPARSPVASRAAGLPTLRRTRRRGPVPSLASSRRGARAERDRRLPEGTRVGQWSAV